MSNYNIKNAELVILDDKTSEENPNFKPTIFDESTMDYDEVQKRAINALRYQKASATRKATTKYKKAISKSLQALADGTYCTLTDGTVLTGADVIALGIFERATSNDKSAKLLMEATGDLSSKEESNETSYESFLENVRIKL